MAENIPKTLIIYAEANGNEPLMKWLQSLRDGRSRKRIEKAAVEPDRIADDDGGKAMAGVGD